MCNAFAPLKFAIVLLLFAPLAVQAKIIQILHTNDLHASLLTKGAPIAHEIEYGGWAQIKTVMDRLTAEAKENKLEGNPNGIETLRLDAGDFSEGTLFYFPDQSVHVLRAHQALGFDAVTLGNHDWMMGARTLDKVLAQSDKRFSLPLLAANVKISCELKNVAAQVAPSRQFVIDGVKVGIFGLTTNEAFYKWITKVDSKRKDLKITKYTRLAKKLAAQMQKENDMVIALTHIGFGHDRALAKKVNGIDLIVGGHSHTYLDTYAVVDNPSGEPVPIVQAGFNGSFIGRVFVDVNPGQKPKVISYEVIPVLNSEKKDPVVADLVQKAVEAVNLKYTPEVLNRVVGRTEVRLVSGTQGPTAFGKFAADAMLDSIQAEAAVDVGSFQGNTPEPAGIVTRKSLMSMYPRKFESSQDEGWSVYKAFVPGWLIKLAVKYAVSYGVYFSLAGINFEVEKMSDEEFDREVAKLSKQGKITTITPYRAVRIKVGGNKLKNIKRYSIAAPEGLIRGAYGVTKFTHLIIHRGRSTGITLWDAFEKYLGKIGVIRRLDPKIHFNGKEFSPSYENYQQRLREEQMLEESANAGEALPLKWTTDHVGEEVDGLELLNQFWQEADERAKNSDVNIPD